MRPYLLLLLSFALPCAALAAEAPPGQEHIGAKQILRGAFTQTHEKIGKPPVMTSGRFTIAPAYGLIWNIEQPFPTASVITPAGIAQELGGVAAMKVPADKIPNMRHLYDMVSHALTGDWSELNADFDIAIGGDAGNWQVLLAPRNQNSGLHYTTISVKGGRFVESIAMLTQNGTADTLTFSDETLSPLPPSPQEAAAFAQAKQ